MHRLPYCRSILYDNKSRALSVSFQKPGNTVCVHSVISTFSQLAHMCKTTIAARAPIAGIIYTSLTLEEHCKLQLLSLG